MTSLTMNQPSDSQITIPDHLAPLFKKYKSWGAAVKANDCESLQLILSYLQEQKRLKPEELSRALAAGANQMNPDMADLLIGFGATLDEKIEGQDAVQVALSAKNHALVLHFLDQGLVSPDHTESDGTTLLMAALLTEQFDLADQLMARGADIDKQRLEFSGGADTALHLAARQASFQAIIWLIENGANPSIENAERRQACESIPELDKDSAKEWDLDAMFDALEDYKDARKKGEAFEIPERMREMAHLESTPMSSMEAAMKEMLAKAEKEEEKSIGLLPKKKKMGF